MSDPVPTPTTTQGRGARLLAYSCTGSALAAGAISLIIGICLLPVGAVVNFAVTLACIDWADACPYIGDPTKTTAWPRPVPEDWPAPHQTAVGSAFGATEVVSWNVAPGPEGHQLRYEQRLSRLGWPLRSFEGEERIVNDFEAGPMPLSYQLSPFRWLWLGFAVNTMFYATFLWLVICGPFVLRRFLRVWRGLCPKCAYPMGESPVCTECGTALPRRRWDAHLAEGGEA